MKSKIMPPTYFVIFLALEVALHFMIPVKKVICFPVNLTGILLIIAGMVLNVWADSLFKKGVTTVRPYEKPSHLETGGPFRISRHPMYLGMVLILLGGALVLGSVVTFIFPVIFIVLMETFFVPPEENTMAILFGQGVPGL